MATVEQTLMKVQRIITGAMKLRAVALQNGFQVRFEDMSTALNIEVHEWGKDEDDEPRSLVQLWAPVLRNVRPAPELFEWIGRNAGSVIFGRLEVHDDKDGTVLLVFTHTLLGDYLDEPELRAAMWTVLATADRMDDELKQKFGGQLWVET